MLVDMIVVQQGAIRVADAHLVKKSRSIVCIYVDLHTKRAEVYTTHEHELEDGCMIPSIWLGACEETAYMDETKDRDELTCITFPKYVDWYVFVAERTGKYSINVCLIRK